MRIIDQVSNSNPDADQAAAPVAVMPGERNVNSPWEPGDAGAGAADLPGGGVGTGLGEQSVRQSDAFSSDTYLNAEDVFDFADVDEVLNGNAPRDIAGGLGGGDEAATASRTASSIEDIFAGTGFSDLEEVAIEDTAVAADVDTNTAATANSQSLEDWINDFMLDIDAHEQAEHADYATDYGYDDGLFG